MATLQELTPGTEVYIVEHEYLHEAIRTGVVVGYKGSKTVQIKYNGDGYHSIKNYNTSMLSKVHIKTEELDKQYQHYKELKEHYISAKRNMNRAINRFGGDQNA